MRLILTLAAWGIAGIAGIILIGPVLGVLAIAFGLIVAAAVIVAPFVILGLLFYLPYRLLVRRDLGLQQVREASGTAWRSTVVPPAHWCAGMVRGTGLVCGRLAAVAGIALETICGGLIGTGLGLLLASSLSKRETVLYALLGGLTGAVLGLLVGLANHVPALRGRTSSS
jgi:hypothetical protein